MRSIRLREPFSGLSHLAGALLGVVALVALLLLAHGDTRRVVAFAIYGASLILLYSASATYHLAHASPRVLESLRRFDHAAIFVLIAGSYTPVCLVELHNREGQWLLAGVWAIAAIGVTLEGVWRTMPDWVDLVLYLIMGWLAIAAIGPIAHIIGPVALRWLVGGGVLYTVGAAVYAAERPRLWPGVFGPHDLWHLFVLAGSAAHFMLMLTFASPAGGS